MTAQVASQCLGTCSVPGKSTWVLCWRERRWNILTVDTVTLAQIYVGHCGSRQIYFVRSDNRTDLFWSVCHRDRFMLSTA